ncbi:MAG: DUF480 domain-containing protein, partial [Wenzhouxiangella sp.]
DAPMVVDLGRAPGQREDRYMHLLCGPVSADMLASVSSRTSTADQAQSNALADRVAELEQRVAALEAKLDNDT